jgi:uncharacterized protein YbbC (DUF1343 family)
VLIYENINQLKPLKVGLITNQTGVLSDGTHMLDALLKHGIDVVKLFSPEHGIRGDENYSDIDPQTGIHIVSLYGGKTAPSKDDLADVDVLLYDIQDVGARFYTYTSTLYYCLKSASDNNKKLIVCDRPVILDANYTDGFALALDPAFVSFVGTIPAPVCYGMTCGELAQYLKDVLKISANMLEVSKMENYSRSRDYASLNLPWVKPSPNMFSASTALVYPGTCFLEGTNVSEGRGTEKPFENIGAPWCTGDGLAQEMNSYNLPGVKFEAVSFTPKEKVSDYEPKFFNKQCSGIYFNVTDKHKFEPVKAGIALLISLKKLFPDFKFNKDNYIDKLAGTDRLRKMVMDGKDLNAIVDSYKKELDEFKELRKKYLIYN